MFDFGYIYEDTTKRVTDAADVASFRNVGHAAATIRNDAIASIQPAPGPSPAGSPPHTHTGGVNPKSGKTRKGVLQKAIVFFQDPAKQFAIVGPRESVTGEAGEAHEFGGEFRGEQYPERAFMGPALQRNQDRFTGDFAGSIGQ
jgi:hypothetical protein